MIRGNLVKGLPQIQNPSEIIISYISSKHSRTPFSSSIYKAWNVLELVHMDICGPISPPTLGGKRYFFLIVDDCLRCVWVGVHKANLDAFEQFKHFKPLAEAYEKWNSV